MSKLVKNEQWRVSILINKMDNKEISKPKFQRKKKWDILPKKENNPNEKSYIMFYLMLKIVCMLLHLVKIWSKIKLHLQI
jgi:hypothetical protein